MGDYGLLIVFGIIIGIAIVIYVTFGLMSVGKKDDEDRDNSAKENKHRKN